MYVNQSTNNTSFQRIITGRSAMTAVKSNKHGSNMANQYLQVKKAFCNAKISKSDVLDVIIHFNKEKGFYGVITTKDGIELTESSAHFYNIRNIPECTNDIKTRFNSWVKYYN